MKKPYISTIIVARNAGKSIEKSLKSLIEQDYPKDLYEIIFVDGVSEDQTLKIAENILENSKLDYQIIINPKKTLASGWNLAIKKAKGNYVVRIDAHVEAYKDFLDKSISTLLEMQDVTCVGGKAITVVEGKNHEIISNVLSSPFGVGNSTFRVSNTAQYADTAACGLYRKEIFDVIGFFDESLGRSQDTELHARITAAGGKFYFNPEIKVKYYARNTYTGIIKQAYHNGKWNIAVWKKNKRSLMLRHLIPLFFVLSIIILGTLSIFSMLFLKILLCELIFYFILALFAGLQKNRYPIQLMKTIFLFFLMHTAYGIGSINSFIHYRNL